MKALNLFSLLFLLQFVSPEAHAFGGYDQFEVELVKPKGEFGFRALGRGKHFTEMRFDCGQASEMGLVVSVVNTYGKTSNIVLPAGELGADKYTCKKNLKQYFAGVYSKRGLASHKISSEGRTIELRVQENKTLSFR